MEQRILNCLDSLSCLNGIETFNTSERSTVYIYIIWALLEQFFCVNRYRSYTKQGMYLRCIQPRS